MSPPDLLGLSSESLRPRGARSFNQVAPSGAEESTDLVMIAGYLCRTSCRLVISESLSREVTPEPRPKGGGPHAGICPMGGPRSAPGRKCPHSGQVKVNVVASVRTRQAGFRPAGTPSWPGYLGNQEGQRDRCSPQRNSRRSEEGTHLGSRQEPKPGQGRLASPPAFCPDPVLSLASCRPPASPLPLLVMGHSCALELAAVYAQPL